MRLLTVSLLAVLCWLQYDFWLGKNGMMDYLAAKGNVAVQQQANAELVQRNQQMYAEIHDLHRGQEAVEERARNELGMIKPGETFFRIVSD
ncbi:cell division protein FtsB [Photobacterium chitinilyticum]|uniref:Cell division protein FtsB n=1 Tax=Photobacterium chitinilyticum TaxID=2485123 RepID=A0A3S3R644_9GAMM|nr:cell division protein FtsB [Photobacterium chitinilyticum]RWX53253.1 cell division protein FtsB [Photobacterium chitinilyticum]